jgi:hypothetical protein
LARKYPDHWNGGYTDGWRAERAKPDTTGFEEESAYLQGYASGENDRRYLRQEPSALTMQELRIRAGEMRALRANP